MRIMQWLKPDSGAICGWQELPTHPPPPPSGGVNEKGHKQVFILCEADRNRRMGASELPAPATDRATYSRSSLLLARTVRARERQGDAAAAPPRGSEGDGATQRAKLGLRHDTARHGTAGPGQNTESAGSRQPAGSRVEAAEGVTSRLSSGPAQLSLGSLAGRSLPRAAPRAALAMAA